MELRLRPYQEEVVQAALRGENSIIWLPTGGGKTRAAVYVAEKHLETKANAKVAVLVNKVHLVDQHYMKEFGHYLRHKYRIKAISGDSSEKDFFGRLVRVSDLVICTAQILENALNNMDEDKHVEITDFTLLVIDECHHTNKESVYNKIMWRYVEKKVRKEGRLPQILGLTASPGTGGNKSLDKAVEHVLQICANLDSKIVSTKNYTPMLQNFVPKPKKEYDIVERRDKDPFGDHLKSMMLMIHEFMPPTVSRGLRELGTQEYEADVVELEKAGVKVNNRLIAQCALHLRKYNDALLINDTIRMVDAFRVLEEFYNSRSSKLLDGTDIFLQGLFDENSLELKHLASDARYENPKLAQLQSRLLEEFQDTNSRGIIFSKTRRGTHCLNDWVKTNRELQRVNITAGILTGAGNGANNMTQVFELQKTAVVIRMEAERKRDAKKQRYSPGQVQLQCRSCFASVCSGGDIRKIENSHHVNVNTEFKNHYKVGDQVNMERTFEDWEPGRIISCRKCKKDWGFEIKFKKVAILPCLKIKSFSFNTPKETKPYKKWKDVEFQVTEFDFIEYMSCRFPDLDLSD
nr:probable ATP-dependent RNA helicase DHX58 isoform X2 [Danio rerio]|eukprot:XP_021324793.1 probable ATP-dependent RNA helicase DHX58 isoform X2 [Danio rerio]